MCRAPAVSPLYVSPVYHSHCLSAARTMTDLKNREGSLHVITSPCVIDFFSFSHVIVITIVSFLTSTKGGLHFGGQLQMTCEVIRTCLLAAA